MRARRARDFREFSPLGPVSGPCFSLTRKLCGVDNAVYVPY